MTEARSSSSGWWKQALVMIALGAAAPGFPAAWAQDDTPHVEVYGFVQADYIQDFNRVDPAWEDTLRPSKIPTRPDLFGDDGQASMSAKQSRLGVLMNFPTSNKTVYTKFEFDMFGVGVDAGQTTIRLRHAYGQWGHWLAGQTNSLFMDASIFPNVIDYWGPAGMVFLRTPQVRWTPFSGDSSFSIAVEKPGSDIDPGEIRVIDPNLGASLRGTEKVPDLTGQYRTKTGFGHLQFAGILRQVSFETPGAPGAEPNGSEMGWGVDVTSGIKAGESNEFLLGVVYGAGIASFMNDGGVDLAPDGTVANPEAKAVPLLGVSAYLNHRWGPRFASAFGYSRTQVDNTSLQSADAFYAGSYASVNLLYYPTKNVMIGGEGLWGAREDNDGSSGHDARVQFSFHYSFSTKDIFKKN